MVRGSYWLPAMLLLAISTVAHACSCASMGGGGGAAKPGSDVFVGEVLDAETVRVPMHIPGRSDLFTRAVVVHLRVTEGFGDEYRPGQVVAVRTGMGGGDCGYAFSVGLRYLIDAYRQPVAEDDPVELKPVRLSTGICSRTQPEAQAAALLSELRTAMARGRQPDLHGVITRTGMEGFQDRQPVAGVAVTLVSQVDRSEFHSTTDAEGHYVFEMLPAGKYSATFALPPHTVLLNPDSPTFVVIPANDGTGLACHLSAIAGPTGGIKGFVVDAQGKPIEGGVYAYPHGKYQEKTFPNFSDYANAGLFSLVNLPDGDYDVVFNNNQTRRHAMVEVVVRDGDVVPDVKIELP